MRSSDSKSLGWGCDSRWAWHVSVRTYWAWMSLILDSSSFAWFMSSMPNFGVCHDLLCQKLFSIQKEGYSTVMLLVQFFSIFCVYLGIQLMDFVFSASSNFSLSLPMTSSVRSVLLPTELWEKDRRCPSKTRPIVPSSPVRSTWSIRLASSYNIVIIIVNVIVVTSFIIIIVCTIIITFHVCYHLSFLHYSHASLCR